MSEHRKEASGAGLAIGGSIGLLAGAVLGGPAGSIILGTILALFGHGAELASLEEDRGANISPGSDPRLISRKITVTGRHISKPVLVQGTGAHRAQRIIVRNGIASAEDAEVRYD